MKPRENHGSVALVILITLTLAFAGALATFGPSQREDAPVSAEDVELRWSANPFPGEK